MLAVDRQQQASPTLARGERELAGGDEALLVRERERDAALERPERRAAVRRSRRPRSGRRRARRARAARSRSPPTCVSGARPSIGFEPEAAATSSSSGFASTISSACRPIDPVAPRRATRFIDFSVGRRSCSRPRPETNSSESIRSSTPPWPPRSFPLSFTCMSRLTADSKRSPIVPRSRSRRRARASPRSRGSGRDPGRARRRRRARDAANPTTKPSHVFPGDMIAASLWRPKRRPAKYAAVSPAHTANSTVKIASLPMYRRRCPGAASGARALRRSRTRRRWSTRS